MREPQDDEDAGAETEATECVISNWHMDAAGHSSVDLLVQPLKQIL